MAQIDNTGRLRDPQAPKLQGVWQANTAAGALTLGAFAFLVALRVVFRKNLGG